MFKKHCLENKEPLVIIDQESSDITRVCSVFKNLKHPDEGFVPEYQSLAVLG